MRRIQFFAFTLSLIFLGPLLASAQQLPTTWQDGSFAARMKAIYEENAYRAEPFRAEWGPDGSWYSMPVQASDSTRVRFDSSTGERLEQLEKKANDEASLDSDRLVSPDGKLRLKIRDSNLILINQETDEERKLTDHDSDEDLRIRSVSWSVDGQYIAYVQADDRNVRKRTMLVPSDPSYPGTVERRFARVGESITKLRVGILDVTNNMTTWVPIETPGEGFYLGQIEWKRKSNKLLIEWLSRFRNKRVFYLASPAGKLRRIFKEQREAWVVSSQGKNSGLVWLQDEQDFVVISEKDGWRHAYKYSKDGEQIALLTPGDFDVIERAVIDEERGWYYFYASPKNATEQYLYRVALDGTGKRERVSPQNQPGWHTYDFSPGGRFAFHTYSTFDDPPIVELVELEGHRTVKRLEENEELKQLASSVIKVPSEFIQLKTADKITMDAWMIKPSDFDPTKKYPLFIYEYGEPHLQTVLNRWGAAQSHYLRAIADLGYVVVSIDNRGTPAPKGAAWRRSIFRSLGPLSTDDQAAALTELGRTRSFVDLSRVGIWGWSGGGSNTLNAMFRHPDKYHVGIAVVPKPQPHLYNAWFQEIYMQDRKVNAEGYERSAPINFAEGLAGKLLMVTGSGETNTHIQIIEGLVDRLIELGKPFDYMVYPNRNHGLREGPGTSVHVRMLIARYLLENLPSGPMTTSN